MVSAPPTRTGPLITPEPVLLPPANLVSPRAVRYWFARAATAWALLLGVQELSWRLDWSFPPWHDPLLVASAVIAVAHVAVMPRWRYRVHRWELTDEAVYTRAGWSRRSAASPRCRASRPWTPSVVRSAGCSGWRRSR